MWPTLWGAGWVWGGFVALALLCFVVGGLGFLFVITGKPRARPPDDLGDAWHRYEEGDLTPSEWQRLQRPPKPTGHSM